MKKDFVVMLVLVAIFFPFYSWASEDMEKVDSDDYFGAKKKIQAEKREKERASCERITVEYYPLPISSGIGWKFKEACEKYTWNGEKITPLPIKSALVCRIAYRPKRPNDEIEGGFAIIYLDGIKKAWQIDLNIYILKPKEFISGRFETYSSIGILVSHLIGKQRYIDERYYLCNEGANLCFGLQGFIGLKLHLTTFLALDGKVGYTYYDALADLSEGKNKEIPSELCEYSNIDLGGLTIKGGITISF
jgi:hypothetical protein